MKHAATSILLLSLCGTLCAQNANQQFAGFADDQENSPAKSGEPKAGDAPFMPSELKASLLPQITSNPPPLYWPRMRIWQGIASVEVSDGGRLWATWYSGNVCEGAARHFSILATSGDGGETWNEVAVFDPSTLAEGSGGDPSIWKNSKGEVFWILNRKLLLEPKTSPRSCWYVKIKNPEDEAPSFGKPKFMGRAVDLNKPLELAGGKIFIPMNKMDKCLKRIIFFEADADAGNARCVGDWGGDYTLLSEPMAYQRRDGSIVCLVRSNEGIVEIVSKDGGESWSAAEKFSMPVSVGTRFFVGRLKSGNLLLVANDHPKARDNMTAFLSEDDGKTWPYKISVDARKGVSYPDAAQGQDGFIYVINDHGRYNKGQQEIVLSKITEEDIRAGELVSNGSYLAKTVSKLADHGGGVHEDKESVNLHRKHTNRKALK